MRALYPAGSISRGWEAHSDLPASIGNATNLTTAACLAGIGTLQL